MKLALQIAAALSAATFAVAKAQSAKEGEGKDEADQHLAAVAVATHNPRVSERDVTGPYGFRAASAGRRLGFFYHQEGDMQLQGGKLACANCHLREESENTGTRGLISGLLSGACPFDETGEPQILDDDGALSDEALADCCTQTLDDSTTKRWTASELKLFLQEEPSHNITDADWIGRSVEALMGMCASSADAGAGTDTAADASTSGNDRKRGNAGIVTSAALFSTLVMLELSRGK